MPVTLNEPLSALQRLCEDLEYSELLDEAASHTNVYDRMVSSTALMMHRLLITSSLHHNRQVKVAAFAVSSFALNYHRAGRKPFNPILGETYECVREDKGFKFIAEQVWPSHTYSCHYTAKWDAPLIITPPPVGEPSPAHRCLSLHIPQLQLLARLVSTLCC